MALKAKVINNSRVEGLSEQQGFTRLNSNIPIDMYQSFKITCLRNRTTMTDILLHAVQDYIAKNNKRISENE